MRVCCSHPAPNARHRCGIPSARSRTSKGGLVSRRILGVSPALGRFPAQRWARKNIRYPTLVQGMLLWKKMVRCHSPAPVRSSLLFPASRKLAGKGGHSFLGCAHTCFQQGGIGSFPVFLLALECFQCAGNIDECFWQCLAVILALNARMWHFNRRKLSWGVQSLP